jgi:hypothetical protein
MNARTILISVLFSYSASAERLPRVDDAFLNEVHRIAITLKIAEYPIPLARVEEVLALPAIEQVFGLSGKDIAPRLVWALSEKDDPLGYYGLRVFYRPTAGGPLEVTKLELFYKPAYKGRFPPLGDFVLDIGEINQEVFGDLRQDMRTRGMSPGEYVKYRYAERRPNPESSVSRSRHMTPVEQAPGRE